MYEMPTWWELGNWYGWPPISSMWKPNGKMTAAKQKRTTKNMLNINLDLISFVSGQYLLAVNPTHLAYGMTSRSQLLDANKMIVVVMQMQPTKMHIRAISHSGCNSGVKQTWGLLYSVMQVHMSPNRVSPAECKDAFLESIQGIHIILKVYNKLPPTSVTIQSGIARLTMAKTSAAINSVALTVVNLSI